MTTTARHRALADARATIATHRDDRLALALADIDAALVGFCDACHRMQDARRSGLAAASYDGPAVSGGGGSNPTLRLALTKDPTAGDRHRLDLAIVTLARFAPVAPDHRSTVATAAYELRRIVAAWTPRRPTDRDRREVTTSNAADECALTREALGLWARPYRTSNLHGLLPDPQPVCRWAYDFARRMGRLPTPMEWKRHASDDDDLRSQLVGSIRR